MLNPNYYYMYSGDDRCPVSLKHTVVRLLEHQTPNFGYRSAKIYVVVTHSGFKFLAHHSHLQRLPERVNVQNQSFIKF